MSGVKDQDHTLSCKEEAFIPQTSLQEPSQQKCKSESAPDRGQGNSRGGGRLF